MKKISFVVMMLAFFSFGAVAEDVVKTYSDADYQAVYQLFDVMNLKQEREDTVKNMLDIQIRSMPMLGQFRQEMLDFMNKYISYDAMKKDLADIYLKYFTVNDLKGLVAFYQTPIGKKYLSVSSQLNNDIMNLSARIMQEHREELQQMIMAKMQQAQKK